MAKDLALPKIYPITDRAVSGLSHLEQISALLDGGSRLIQLRDKSAPSRELLDQAIACLELTRQNGAMLIINDRVDIALAVGADGVHLGQDDLPPSEARRILGDDRLIGYSTHSLEQAKAALDQPVDYIAIGPIFATRTKADHDHPVGLEGIEHVKSVIGDIPLVAIGGIGIDDIVPVLSAGAGSVAMISSLLNEPGQISVRTKNAFKTAGQKLNVKQ